MPRAPIGSPAAATAGGDGTKVYVGNLSWETSWQDLKDHFRSVGEVMHADMMIGCDGRSKGCGLVTFANPHDAARAIETLHDSVLHSRAIFVREDREADLDRLRETDAPRWMQRVAEDEIKARPRRAWWREQKQRVGSPNPYFASL